MKLTYFVHGTTTDNERGLATGCLPGELSKLGIQQAKDLPKQAKDNTFTVMYSSDLKRATDSATLGFGKTHELRVDKRLREADYGEWNGGSHHFKSNMQKYVDSPFPGGGTYRDVENNMRSFLRDVSKEFPNGHIAIMAHEAPQLALEVIVKNKTWDVAINENWRKTKSWKPGWIYEI